MRNRQNRRTRLGRVVIHIRQQLRQFGCARLAGSISRSKSIQSGGQSSLRVRMLRKLLVVVLAHLALTLRAIKMFVEAAVKAISGLVTVLKIFVAIGVAAGWFEKENKQ